MSYNAKPIWFLNSENPSPQIREAIDRFYKVWLPLHSKDSELVLYHYTTLDGLKGIIKNRSLWLTHTSALNDPTELKYGRDLILGELDNAIFSQENKNIKELFNSIKDNITSFDEVMYDTYVSCFCESDKLLSQWRAYGHRGGGYSIGIEFTTDTKFYDVPDQSKKDNHIILRKIIYDTEKQKELVKEYISLIDSYAGHAIKYHEKRGGLPADWGLIAAMDSANLFIDLMLSFKNEVFSEEKEWRLILVRTSSYKAEHLKFIEKNVTLIPYFEMFICENIKDIFYFPLRTIRFGPMLDIQSTKSTLRLFMEKESTNKENIQIMESRTHIFDAGFSLR